MERNKVELHKKNSALAQQWLESLNSYQNHQLNQTQNRGSVPNIHGNLHSFMNRQKLLRDCSFQSDDSHCSSVESVLELRKPDPEEVLLGLGFGPKTASVGSVGRIPSRFLQPSKLITHIDINKFLERYGQDYPDLLQSAPQSPAKIQKSH